MELLEALKPALLEIATVLFTAFAGWLAVKVNEWLYANKEEANAKQTRAIVEATVKYVEQVAKSLGSEEKFALAKEKAVEWINAKGLSVSEVELEVLIEACVNEFFGKYEENFIDKLGGGSAGEAVVSSVD